MSPSTPSLTSTLILSLLLLLLSPATLAQTDDLQLDDSSTQNTCLLVAPTTSTEFAATYNPLRISPALTCPSPSPDPCPLESWAYISLATRLNVSTPDGDAQRDALLRRLVGGVASEPILLAREGIEGVVANETFAVEPGESAYMEFAAECACRGWYVDGTSPLFRLPSTFPSRSTPISILLGLPQAAMVFSQTTAVGTSKPATPCTTPAPARSANSPARRRLCGWMPRRRGR